MLKSRLETVRNDISIFQPEKKPQTDSDRAAKHRLGVKITEIGRLLQWWSDLEPVFSRLYDPEGDKPTQSFLALKEGITNVRRRRRD